MDSANRASADLQRLISSLPEFLSLADPDIAQMHPLQRAESMLVLAKAASSLLSMRLGCAGVNPADHSIKSELERISLYEAKLERFMDLNKEKNEWAIIFKNMLGQEKAPQGVRKRKRDDDNDEVIVISSSSTRRSGGVVLGREAPSEQEPDEEGEALIQRARKVQVRRPSPANTLPAASQELDHPPVSEHPSLGTHEPVGSTSLERGHPPRTYEAPLKEQSMERVGEAHSPHLALAEEQSADSIEEVSLPLEDATNEGGLLNDVETQLRFTDALQRFRGELPIMESREDLFIYARYHSLVGAMIPGMLMEAWRQERSNIQKLESQVKHLTKKRNNWRKQRRNMRASIQDLKSQVDVVESEITDAREESKTLRGQLAAERAEGKQAKALWDKKLEALKKQLAAEKLEKERLQAQWTAEKEQLQSQVQESSQALSLAASGKAEEIGRAKQEAVETFKSSDAFTEELTRRSGKALEESLRSVRDDLQRLYPDVVPSRVPSFGYLLQLEEMRSSTSKGTPM